MVLRVVRHCRRLHGGHQMPFRHRGQGAQVESQMRKTTVFLSGHDHLSTIIPYLNMMKISVGRPGFFPATRFFWNLCLHWDFSQRNQNQKEAGQKSDHSFSVVFF